MSQEPFFPQSDLIPPPAMPCDADAHTEQLLGLLNGQPKEEDAVEQAVAGMDEFFDKIAAGLYTLASMLVGEGEESVQLVETAVATADVGACHDALEARQSSHRALAEAAIRILARRDPAGLASPQQVEAFNGCIADDDLDAVGVSKEELVTLMAGPDRGRVRAWLSSLPIAARVIFALRAVAGFHTEEVAVLLAAEGGPQAAGWTADAVRVTFRQALCSLASQLLQASTAS